MTITAKPAVLSILDLDRIGRLLHRNGDEAEITQSVVAGEDCVWVCGALFNKSAFLATLRRIVPDPDGSAMPSDNDGLYGREDGTIVKFDDLTRDEMLNALQQQRSTIRTLYSHITLMRERRAQERANVLREIAAHITKMADTPE